MNPLQSLVSLCRTPLWGTPDPRDGTLGFFQLFAITKKKTLPWRLTLHLGHCVPLQLYLRNKFLEVELQEQMVHAFEIFTDFAKSPSTGAVSIYPFTSSVSWQRLPLFEPDCPLCLLGATLWASKAPPLLACLPMSTDSPTPGKSCQEPAIDRRIFTGYITSAAADSAQS